MADIGKPTVVIDVGSGVCKAGLGGELKPSVVFPAIVGRPKFQRKLPGMSYKDPYLGKDAYSCRGVMDLTYPVERGVVTHWDDMERILHNIFCSELRLVPSEHPAIVVDSPLNTEYNREKMIQVIFEWLDCPAFYVNIDAVFSLYACGRNCGVVLSSGYGVTHVISVYEGDVLPQAVESTNFAGEDLSEYLKQMLQERGYGSTLATETETVRDIKEKLCYVASDFQEESLSAAETSYELPDGTSISIGKERCQCPEIFFNPMLAGKQFTTIPNMIINSLKAANYDNSQDSPISVLIAGGSTMFPGMATRIEKELKNIWSCTTDLSICAPEKREFLAWTGGSMLSSMSTFSDMWLTKDEYEECGPTVLCKKCKVIPLT